jgi:ubiquinone/menaquinone biosynthesis C-methylase UbiE
MYRMTAKNTRTGSFAALKEFWEERGRTRSFERQYWIRLEGIRRILHEVRSFLRDRLVLDVGCGPGIAASFFPANSRLVGLDFSAWMLRSAKTRIPTLIQGSAFSLPVRQCCFDAITCFFVASDYPDKAGIFSECHRVLRENGTLLFSDYSLNDQHWVFRTTISSLLGEPCRIFLRDETSLSHEMRKAGFDIKETKRVYFRAPFRLELYVRSEHEKSRLRAKNVDLWKKLQRYIASKDIRREFILIIGVKSDLVRKQQEKGPDLNSLDQS